MTLRHRYLLAVPFVLLAVATVAGGWVNTTDAHARIVDTFTDKPVESARISLGSRKAQTGADGEFRLPSVPRTANYQIDAPGYLRTSAPVSVSDIRLSPLSVTIYVYDATKTPRDRLKSPEARDAGNTKTIAVGNESGQIVVAPHPGRDAKLLICAAGFQAKTITVEGVLMQVGVDPGTPGCAPLPTPTPTATPSGSPAPSGSPSAAPSPSASPSPTASP